ncbi:hypothetical protein QJS04_geneDACA015708 [Acorus gramineus]|uniref:Uncharacterized protein n=1 Tax=Acorus gramineus TaxID=55184 RepID=A0AAV9AM90_ACOGR|nr:hypothetical protein QJS04_geneDACA015708 [Acorus gramineus]
MLAEVDVYVQRGPVVYVSVEESIEQIGNRAHRMRIGTSNLYLYSSTDVEIFGADLMRAHVLHVSMHFALRFVYTIQDILEKIHSLSPRALIVDSIQTVYSRVLTGSVGNVQQNPEIIFE